MKKILMICLGNICRSPLAEGILQSKLTDNCTVDSAGTISFHQGSSPDPRSILVAQNNGIDIASQKSRKINEQDFLEFDFLFCMDRSVYNDVQKLCPNAQYLSKVHLFLPFAGISDIDEVPDPYYGELIDFEKVYALLDRACTKVVDRLI